MKKEILYKNYDVSEEIWDEIIIRVKKETSKIFMNIYSNEIGELHLEYEGDQIIEENIYKYLEYTLTRSKNLINLKSEINTLAPKFLDFDKYKVEETNHLKSEKINILPIN